MTIRVAKVRATRFTMSFLLAGAGWLLAAQGKPARTDLSADTHNSEAGKTTFVANCSGCHGIDGKGGDRAPGISSGSDAAKIPDEELRRTIANGVAGAGMPPFASLGNEQITAVMAYVRGLQGKAESFPVPGDPRRGEQLFFGKAGCSGCHMAVGQGGFLASDLTGYGAGRSPNEIHRAITDPSNDDNERGKQATVRLPDGQAFTGVVRSEDNFSIAIQTKQGKFLLLQKAELADVSYNHETLMPKDYGSKLTTQQLDDLVSFLMQLQGKVDPSAAQQKAKGNWEEPD